MIIVCEAEQDFLEYSSEKNSGCSKKLNKNSHSKESIHARLAQWLEHQSYELRVAGSIPALST